MTGLYQQFSSQPIYAAEDDDGGINHRGMYTSGSIKLRATVQKNYEITPYQQYVFFRRIVPIGIGKSGKATVIL